jgi:hypothetical protein
VTSESLALVLENYSAGMRERLAAQKKTLDVLLGSISHNVRDVRAIMRKLENFSFEGGMKTARKAGSKKTVRGKKPVGKKKTALSLAGKNKPKAKKTKTAHKPVRLQDKGREAKTKGRAEKSFFDTQKAGTVHRAVRDGFIEIAPPDNYSNQPKRRQAK